MKKLIYTGIVCLLSLNIFASDESLYDFKWLDEGEKVYVIQNKEFTKAGSLGINVSVVQSDSSAFQNTSGFVGTISYYPSENWSLDITYKQYENSDSDDLTNLLTQIGGGIKPIIRKINTASLLHVNWIPFYGKLNTFNRVVFFDWGLGLGVGQFETEGNWKTFDQTNIGITYEAETDTGFNFKSFIQFYTQAGITLGLEYNLTGVDTIKDPNGVSQLLYYVDLMASVGYLF